MNEGLTEDKMMKRTAIVPEMKILFRLARLRREYMKRRKTLSPDGHRDEECTVPVRKAWTSNLVHSVRVEDEMQVTPLFKYVFTTMSFKFKKLDNKLAFVTCKLYHIS